MSSLFEGQKYTETLERLGSEMNKRSWSKLKYVSWNMKYLYKWKNLQGTGKDSNKFWTYLNHTWN